MAFPLLIGAGISAAAQIGSGILGNMAAGEERDKAEAAINEALQIARDVGAPPDQSQAILLEKLQSVGVLTPELEQNINLQFQELGPVDTQGKEAQIAALREFGELSKTGMTPVQRAELERQKQQIGQEQKAKLESIVQNQAARGLAGSGTETAARLLSAQEGANTERMAGLQTAAEADKARIAALQSMGSLGGEYERQQYGEASDQQKAKQATEQFNVQNAIAQAANDMNAGLNNVGADMRRGFDDVVGDLRYGLANTSYDISQAVNGVSGRIDSFTRRLMGDDIEDYKEYVPKTPVPTKAPDGTIKMEAKTPTGPPAPVPTATPTGIKMETAPLAPSSSPPVTTTIPIQLAAPEEPTAPAVK